VCALIKSSLINHQSSVISRVVYRQSSIVNQQSQVVSRQLTTAWKTSYLSLPFTSTSTSSTLRSTSLPLYLYAPIVDMAPPPSASLPLTERIKKLAQTLQ
jgi:hypothetical protein